MSETVLDRLALALDGASSNDGNVFQAPVAVLWPDKGRQWKGLIERLRTHRRVLTLGPHQPDAGQGPAYWLRCVVAGTLDVDGPQSLPVLYLPGVSRDDLRSVASDDATLAPLVALQHRSQWFTQANGKDWTIRALLANKDRGLGLSVAGDEATGSALIAGLTQLAEQPLTRFDGRHIDAAFLNNLMNPDPVRLLLRWIDDPRTVEQDLEPAAWAAFVQQCQSDYGFDPAAGGVIEGARRLAEAEGSWHQAWQRYRESPAEYPRVPDRLRDARPLELFAGSNLAWPQDNDAAEEQLRARLLDLPVLTWSGACKEIAALEEQHRARRGSVWAQLGQAPLALALEPLAEVAARSQALPCGSSVVELCDYYAAEGWKLDRSALLALGEVNEHGDLQAVGAALDAVYRPWLDQAAKALQDAVGPEANSGTYAPSTAPTPVAGEVVVFIDGLRLDVAHLLTERLEGGGVEVTVTVGLAALPTVTQTAKAVLAPIDQALLGPGSALDACRSSGGVSAGAQVLRSLMGEAGVQVLGPQDVGDPTGRGWTETGEIDHKGHDLGPRLAHELDGEVQRIARRIRDLLDAGWSKARVVTDHGWLLLPSGLPKNEGLPVAATVAKKGRCARVKDGAAVGVPTVPWHWDKDVRIAVAPGISCFEANQTYEHGGVSPQECVVPRLTITSTATTPTTRAEITNIKWRGLTLVVGFADLPDGAKVDLRRYAGNADSSIADLARVTGGSGKVILLVEDEDLAGEPAQLVVVADDGTVLLQREITVGQNR
jgi:hypothetical protein